jgi:alpha/beta superfamily hydrolase
MRIEFPSGDLRLEGELHLPPGATGAAVICHPHPLYGGNMDNNVVLALDDGFRRAGCATLRFNFRGVGASEGGYESGVGEQDDLRAAATEILSRTGAANVAVAGYSFGAMMAAHAGPAIAALARLVIVAPPLSFGGLGPLAACAVPKLFIVGDRDSYCSLADLTSALAGVVEPKRVLVLRGADHFFAGHEDAIARAL